MPVEFKKDIISVKMLDPRDGFKQNTVSFELRSDPLTGETGAIYTYRLRKFPKRDLDELDRASLEMGCPFCPQSVETMTPKFAPDFLPEGRMRVGNAIVVPNLQPYAPHNGVAILSPKHRIDLKDFTTEPIMDGLQAAQAYLRRVFEFDPAAKYHLVGWNYLPPAGGSLVHPHFQIMGRYIPSRYMNLLLTSSAKYYRKYKSNFWLDLVKEEKARGERYISGSGDVEWITAYVPKSNLIDILTVFPSRTTFPELTRSELQKFCDGLLKVFKFVDESNIYSFNLTFFCGLKGQKHYSLNARTVIRHSPPPLYSSDLPVVPFLHNELFGMIPPEEICQQIREYFK